MFEERVLTRKQILADALQKAMKAQHVQLSRPHGRVTAIKFIAFLLEGRTARSGIECFRPEQRAQGHDIGEFSSHARCCQNLPGRGPARHPALAGRAGLA